MGNALAGLGYIARAGGHSQQARYYLAEALQCATDSGSIFPLRHALPAISLLLVDQGEPERAAELYALASCDPFVANSRWFADVAGRHIAAAAMALSPPVVEAAQARGRERDLWGTAADLLVELQGAGET